MEEESVLLNEAISFYDLDPEGMEIESELPGMYHHDRHFKIRIQDKRYSARFLSGTRYDHNIFMELSDQVIGEQMAYIAFLNRNGIPFMRHVATSDSNMFAKVSRDGVEYRFLLFEWIEGNHITHGTERVAYTFGSMARRLHDVSQTYSCTLPKESHYVGRMKLLSVLESACLTTSLTASQQVNLQDYIRLARQNIDHGHSTKLEFVMQSDLNSLNIIWDDKEQIVGIIDFEHIGYTDRLESLAWMIKWYSRTKGIKSHEVSPKLAASFLQGYGAHDYVGEEERSRLSALLWLTGCLNWGFVNRTMKILNADKVRLEDHLATYCRRGQMLASLI